MRRAIVVGVVLVACGDRPRDDELERWRDEAAAANRAALAAAQRTAADEPGHTLTISGQTRAGRMTLGWAELGKLATAHVATTSPQDPAHAGQVTDFRGVLVRDVLERAGVAADIGELTFVSIDAFRAPVAIADVRRFRTLLAIEAGGAPIPRAQGGPIFLVHPHSESPETVALYPDRYWSFYVTDVIVGTEPARLQVFDRVLDAVALDALPQITWTGVVKYKSFWPSDPVRLRGVRLGDALRAAGSGGVGGGVPVNGGVPAGGGVPTSSGVLAGSGVPVNGGVPAGGSVPAGSGVPADGVIVRGKAAIQRDPKDPRRIAAADVVRCDFLLATHWGPVGGERDEPIPARLGGPITLAVPEACASTYDDHFWMTFVEELVPEPRP